MVQTVHSCVPAGRGPRATTSPGTACAHRGESVPLVSKVTVSCRGKVPGGNPFPAVPSTAPCPAGCQPQQYGVGCLQPCSCQNGGLCNATDGSCSCGLGWTGKSCELGKAAPHTQPSLLRGSVPAELPRCAPQSAQPGALVLTASCAVPAGTMPPATPPPAPAAAPRDAMGPCVSTVS